MNRNIINILLAFITLFLSANAEENKNEKYKVLFINQHAHKIFQSFDLASFSKTLSITLDQAIENSAFNNEIKNYYQKNQLEPVWLSKHYSNGDIDSLLAVFQRSEEHGISAEVFHLSDLKALLSIYREGDFQDISEAYLVISKIEQLASDGYANYISMLRFGILPRSFSMPGYFMHRNLPTANFFEQILGPTSIINTLILAQPTAPAYWVLSRRMLETRDEQERKNIVINLERMRWNNLNYPGKRIIVNIPDFSLSVKEAGHTLLSMPVCVGSFERNKPDHRTPMLYGNLRRIEINPVWNIPFSIASREILPLLKRNPGYLKTKKIQVYLGNKKINPGSVDWKKYTLINFPYALKQLPGKDNAMGNYKFSFDNPYSIFLHDTNDKKRFSFQQRALSHGCIRVAAPQALAQIVAEGSHLSGIFSATKEQKARSYILKQPLPVQIIYQTAMVENETITYLKDIYKLDKFLYETLDKQGVLVGKDLSRLT